MLKQGLIGLSLLAALSAVASADTVITEWGGAQGGYEIDPWPAATVTIFAPGTYKFQALDPNGPDGLGIINHITVDPNCPAGAVNVSVVSLSGGYGALHVREINLSNASDSTIATLKVGGDLAEYGPIVANTVDYMSVGTNVLNSMTIDWLQTQLWCDTIGDLTISSGTAPRAQIFVWDDYAATMRVTGAPWLVIGERLLGTIELTGNPDEIIITDFAETGVLNVLGDLQFVKIGEAGLRGTLHVTGDLTGLIWLPDGSITGAVIVDGDIAPDSQIYMESWNNNISGSVQVGGDCAGYVAIGRAWEGEPPCRTPPPGRTTCPVSSQSEEISPAQFASGVTSTG